MKTSFERPSVWYVIVTLFAMLYLASAPPFIYNLCLAPSLAGCLGGLLLAGAWVFLVFDLIKQIALFFRRHRR